LTSKYLQEKYEAYATFYKKWHEAVKELRECKDTIEEEIHRRDVLSIAYNLKVETLHDLQLAILSEK
jgi:DNA replication initiation complex subunit (GINS family)